MAKLFTALCILLCFFVVCAKSVDEESGTKTRVHDGKLSDQEHYDKEGEHNAEYDHEAFLGKQKKSFDQLTPEESKERLGKIVDRIDKDKDGIITAQELANWIKFTKMQYHQETVDKRWEQLIVRLQSLLSQKDRDAGKTVDPNDPVGWEDYKIASYGERPEESDVYRDQVKLELRRWKAADLDQDGKLSKEEFSALYGPWEFDHMHDVVAQENLDDTDKDKDGLLSLEEYLDEIYRGKSKKEMTEAERQQVEIDKKYFHTHRDKNKDGVMDKNEIKEWVFPTNYDPLVSEAKHLIRHADANKDKVLTKDEILDKYNVFVGSRATNYGKDLTRHDEF